MATLKFKTKKALKKRVRITNTGKMKRHCAYKGHNASFKTSKQGRHLRKARLVSHADYKREKKIIRS